MIPQRVLSTMPVAAPFLPPYDAPWTPLIDLEMGGIALRDPSRGSNYQLWTLQVIGDDVIVSAPEVVPTVLFTREGITEASLAFDQNMNPTVAFVQDGVMWLWWFDTLAVAQVFTEFADESGSPRVCLDDKRDMERATSDVVLVYMRGNRLYFRAQRDRFGVETALAAEDGALPDLSGFNLLRVGMNTVNRLQFQFEKPDEAAP